MSMTVQDYRYLYEGVTQDDDEFREHLYTLNDVIPSDDIANKLISEIELAQNRLNHAMIGVHPLYRREIEISGIIDYDKKALYLFAGDTDKVYPFEKLDASYVAFIENQKRIYNVKDKEILPMSSVALKLSNQMCKEDHIPTPDISDMDMHLPKSDFCYSRRILENAFAKNMVLVNHLREEIGKYHLDKTFEVNKDDLISYCQSKSFDYQFAHSVQELTDIAEVAQGMDDLINKT